METMKAAVLYDVRDLRVVDVPKAQTGDSGVLIKVNTVGVCGTDLHTYKLGMFKEMSLPTEEGALFGHEFAGEVVDIAPSAEVEGIAVGDRVMGVALGAYAEYCSVNNVLTNKPMVVKLPDNVTYEEAATVEPLVVSLTAVKRAGLRDGERVLITGAGMIGLGCVQVIHALHPGCEVIVTDVSDKRLDMARQFGASRTLNVLQEELVPQMKALTGEAMAVYAPTSSGKIDVAIEASGLGGPLNDALELVRPGSGRLICVALYEQKPQVDFNQVVAKNLHVIGTLGYTEADINEALALIAEGKVDRQPLITHRYALADAAEAFEAQLNTAETLKAVIQP
jgi:2-desacetyl-2-hydroxyethyl bacteriochlorophyllide A dehydrogenase